jgi:DNA-binding beta-propeller fold protein YncE
MNTRTVALTALGLGLLATSCDDSAVGTIGQDDLDLAALGKADGQAEVLTLDLGTHVRVRFFGDAASRLYDALSGSELYEGVQDGGRDYVFSDYIGCVSDGSDAACVMAAHRVDALDGFEIAIHGPAHGSAADDMHQALVATGGDDRLVCGEASGEAWCGLRPQARPGQIWVANRAGGTVSVIDAQSQQVRATLTMPDGGEPMYVNHVPGTRMVFVGDRANDRAVVFDADTHAVIGTVAAGAGVFHQWATAEQVWINNDVENTTTVIDPSSLEVLATIAMPADLAAQGGKPHDVFVSPDGDAAFVTYVGFESGEGAVVRFDAHTFQETARASVGNDCHVSATAASPFLHVPCQDRGEVLRLDLQTLEEGSPVGVPGAHGAFMSADGSRFYTTNLPAGGMEALFVVDVATGTTINEVGVDAPEGGSPHNVALSADGRQLYVTHSGATSSLVSFYELDDAGVPISIGALETGANPFGLNVVP